MNVRWAVTLPLNQSLAAGTLRLRDSLLAHVDNDAEQLWIKGSQVLSQDRELDVLLRVLPGVKRYAVNNAGQLIPQGRRLPKGLLPTGSWRSLDSLLILQAQVAAFSGQAPEKIPLRLTRSPIPAPCRLMLTSINALADYVRVTAQCRLDPLRFAMNQQGQALIDGHPQPSISGSLFVQNGCTAWPAGYQITPSLDQTSLQIILGLVPGDLALFSENGQYQIIAAQQFHPLTRANVSASLRGRS